MCALNLEEEEGVNGRWLPTAVPAHMGVQWDLKSNKWTNALVKCNFSLHKFTLFTESHVTHSFVWIEEKLICLYCYSLILKNLILMRTLCLCDTCPLSSLLQAGWMIVFYSQQEIK